MSDNFWFCKQRHNLEKKKCDNGLQRFIINTIELANLPLMLCRFAFNALLDSTISTYKKSEQRNNVRNLNLNVRDRKFILKGFWMNHE